MSHSTYSRSPDSPALSQLFQEVNPFISQEIFFESDVKNPPKIIESVSKNSVSTSAKHIPTIAQRKAWQKIGRANAKVYRLISPEGKRIAIRNLSRFARKHNLDRSSIYKMIDGKRLSHKGYRLHRA